MSAQEQLLNEIENAPDGIIEEILDFCLFLKKRQQAKSEDSASSVPQTTQTNGILDLLRQIEAIQATVPPEEWDKLPHDGSINHDHYLYGSLKLRNEDCFCNTGYWIALLDPQDNLHPRAILLTASLTSARSGSDQIFV